MLSFILLILVALVAIFFLRGKLGVAADEGLTTIDETKVSTLKSTERKATGGASRSPVPIIKSDVKPVEKSLVPPTALKQSATNVKAPAGHAPLPAQTESFASTKTAIQKVGPSDSVTRNIIDNLETSTPNPEVTRQQPRPSSRSELEIKSTSTGNESATGAVQADKKKKKKSKSKKSKKSSKSPEGGKDKKKKSLRLEPSPKA